MQETISNQTIEKYDFDEYDPSELQAVVTTQQKVLDYQKEQNKIFVSDFNLHRWFLQITRVPQVNLNYYTSYITEVGIT